MPVHIEPLPLWCRTIPHRLWPQHPPLWLDGAPTPEDLDEARLLLAALDPESRLWYSYTCERLGVPLEDQPRAGGRRSAPIQGQALRRGK